MGQRRAAWLLPGGRAMPQQHTWHEAAAEQSLWCPFDALCFFVGPLEGHLLQDPALTTPIGHPGDIPIESVFCGPDY